jgi:hypothetical protein
MAATRSPASSIAAERESTATSEAVPNNSGGSSTIPSV